MEGKEGMRGAAWGEVPVMAMTFDLRDIVLEQTGSSDAFDPLRRKKIVNM